MEQTELSPDSIMLRFLKERRRVLRQTRAAPQRTVWGRLSPPWPMQKTEERSQCDLFTKPGVGFMTPTDPSFLTLKHLCFFSLSQSFVLRSTSIQVSGQLPSPLRGVSPGLYRLYTYSFFPSHAPPSLRLWRIAVACQSLKYNEQINDQNGYT